MDRFVIVMELGRNAEPNFLTNEKEEPLRFKTAYDARVAAQRRMFLQTVPWWIIELCDDGMVINGLEVPL